jgi:mono/diheme cytochrome c family protein
MTGTRSALHFLVVSLIVCGIGCSAYAIAADNAATIYSERCAACHGNTGHGDGATARFLKPPPTGFQASLKGKADDWIFKAIKDGGPPVGESPAMPPSKNLSDAEIKELVAYIKQLGGQK